MTSSPSAEPAPADVGGVHGDPADEGRVPLPAGRGRHLPAREVAGDDGQRLPARDAGDDLGRYRGVVRVRALAGQLPGPLVVDPLVAEQGHAVRPALRRRRSQAALDAEGDLLRLVGGVDAVLGEDPPVAALGEVVGAAVGRDVDGGPGPAAGGQETGPGFELAAAAGWLPHDDDVVLPVADGGGEPGPVLAVAAGEPGGGPAGVGVACGDGPPVCLAGFEAGGVLLGDGPGVSVLVSPLPRTDTRS